MDKVRDILNSVLPHMPFVMMVTNGNGQLKKIIAWREIIVALVVSVAIGGVGAYVTIQTLSVKLDYMSRDIANVSTNYTNLQKEINEVEQQLWQHRIDQNNRWDKETKDDMRRRK